MFIQNSRVTHVTYLALVGPRVLELRPGQPEDPVDRLGPVDDLEAAVVGEQGVAVGQDVEVAPADERDLKDK